jgi:hypothetical protein
MDEGAAQRETEKKKIIDRDREDQSTAAVTPEMAGFSTPEEAQQEFENDRIADETFEEFLTRRFCMGDNGPYLGKKASKSSNSP